MTIQVVENGLDYSEMHERMQFYIDSNILSCCSTLVMKGNEVVDHKTFGFMDLEEKQPLLEDAIYRMYSSTKIVTSVALMMLFEEGNFELGDPVSKFISDFDQPRVLKADAKTVEDTEEALSPITISQLLSHSAGLSYGFIEPDSVIDQAYNDSGVNALGQSGMDLEELCSVIARLPLAYQPGTSWRYSFATDVCARLIEVISGRTFDAFLRERLFEPLNMRDTGFWVDESEMDRFVTMYAPTDIFDPMKPGLVRAEDPRSGPYAGKPKFLSGGGGLVSTVSDYLSFLQMIVSGGSFNEVRILKSETLELMRTNQLAPEVGVAFPMWSMPGTVFGLGFALKQSLAEGEPAGALNEYHWGGMAGTHSWMSPSQGITGFCLTQRMPGFWHPFSHEFKAHCYRITR
ncbi:beta-lactamase family protein [Gammaproteobacteria bacterium]|nr:beta-lactamase family protein [Gammaproteobacteria bacterium]